MMRVILEPLIGDVPIVGAVTMFFIQRPVSVSKHILHHYKEAFVDRKVSMYVKGSSWMPIKDLLDEK